MNLLANPIFVTHRRLTHRARAWPMVCIVALLGIVAVVALVRWINDPLAQAERVGAGFYIALLAVQGIILVFGWFGKVGDALVLERQAGLLEANRLAPLTAAQLAAGYLFGPPLRELYMIAALAAVGLAMILLSGLPIGFFLATQALLLATAALAGLLGLLGGMIFQKRQGSTPIVALAILALFLSQQGGPLSLLNFLLPLYAINGLWSTAVGGAAAEAPRLFGLAFHPVGYALATQLLIGLFLWLAAWRKFAQPDAPAFSRPIVLPLFLALVLLQHGMVWHLWAGAFPEGPSERAILVAVHIFVALLGLAIVATQCLNPERVRIAALSPRGAGLGAIAARSGPTLALGLGIIGALALLTHCYTTVGDVPRPFALAAANLALLLLSMALVVETAVVWFGRRGIGIAALALILLYIVPLLLAITVPEALYYSFLAPGAAALLEPGPRAAPEAQAAVIAHAIIIAALAVGWAATWMIWLRTVTAEPTPSQTPPPAPAAP